MVNFDSDDLNWQKVNDLMPAVIQDCVSGRVLMLGYMNREALDKTVETSLVHFWSRTRQQLWLKGETSGNFFKVKRLTKDCDNDTLLVGVEPQGPACHLGHITCFGDKKLDFSELGWLEKVILERQGQPVEQSYTAKLLDDSVERVAKKVGEEAVEVALASMTEDTNHFIDEVSDLTFHMLVLLRKRNVSFSQVIDRLRERSR